MPERIRLTLADSPDPRRPEHAGPFAVRLRLALKCLLRRFGLRVVVMEATPTDPSPAQEDRPDGP